MPPRILRPPCPPVPSVPRSAGRWQKLGLTPGACLEGHRLADKRGAEERPVPCRVPSHDAPVQPFSSLFFGRHGGHCRWVEALAPKLLPLIGLPQPPASYLLLPAPQLQPWLQPLSPNPGWGGTAIRAKDDEVGGREGRGTWGLEWGPSRVLPSAVRAAAPRYHFLGCVSLIFRLPEDSFLLQSNLHLIPSRQISS